MTFFRLLWSIQAKPGLGPWLCSVSPCKCETEAMKETDLKNPDFSFKQGILKSAFEDGFFQFIRSV